MKEITTTRWQAIDGKEFDDREACRKYEEDFKVHALNDYAAFYWSDAEYGGIKGFLDYGIGWNVWLVPVCDDVAELFSDDCGIYREFMGAQSEGEQYLFVATEAPDPFRRIGAPRHFTRDNHPVHAGRHRVFAPEPGLGVELFGVEDHEVGNITPADETAVGDAENLRR